MNGRMITGISILFLKAYIADHDGDDDDAHDVVLMIIMIKLVTMTHQDVNKDADDVHEDNNYDDNCDDNDVRMMMIDYGGDNALNRC